MIVFIVKQPVDRCPSFDIFSVTSKPKMCKENAEGTKGNKRSAASLRAVGIQGPLQFASVSFVCARISQQSRCVTASHGAWTIDSIHHKQSDVVNFTFTIDGQK
jgi:hypothetical protein